MPSITKEQPSAEDARKLLHTPARQILIPIDGTPQGEYMVDWALANFCREGDQVNLIHVIPKCVKTPILPLKEGRHC